ncbi:MAG: DNA alkylation repair protein [Terrimicrobiaceae bacterium]
MTLPQLRQALRSAARPGDAESARRFFKTGPGEYGEGDVFLGVRVPDVRRLVRQTDAIAITDLLELVRSPVHEERQLGLLASVRRFEQGDGPVRGQILHLYLRETKFINNWDLVDCSAPNIVGGWMLEHPADLPRIFKLAGSKDLWKRRIAIISTLALIRKGRLEPTVKISRLLLEDRHDLIHKASGWMLREAGKRDAGVLRDFLTRHAHAMPRTMLRYAIEKLPPAERKKWMTR